MEHHQTWPAEPLPRWIDLSTRRLGEACIHTEIEYVPEHTGIPGNAKADCQGNLVRDGRMTDKVREHVYTSALNWTRPISEARTVAKAEWEANKRSKHHGYRQKGKAGSKRPIPMNRVKPLETRFYELKSGLAAVGTYLKGFGYRENDKWWWCGGRSMIAKSRKHPFRHCS
jgi:hypothetical protein